MSDRRFDVESMPEMDADQRELAEAAEQYPGADDRSVHCGECGHMAPNRICHACPNCGHRGHRYTVGHEPDWPHAAPVLPGADS
jgi:rubrerythrin